MPQHNTLLIIQALTVDLHKNGETLKPKHPRSEEELRARVQRRGAHLIGKAEFNKVPRDYPEIEEYTLSHIRDLTRI